MLHALPQSLCTPLSMHTDNIPDTVSTCILRVMVRTRPAVLCLFLSLANKPICKHTPRLSSGSYLGLS